MKRAGSSETTGYHISTNQNLPPQFSHVILVFILVQVRLQIRNFNNGYATRLDDGSGFCTLFNEAMSTEAHKMAK